MHDCHTHSLYSEDVDKQRGSSIDAMAARALEIGLASIAITDHLEIDNVGSPLHEPLDSDGIRRDVMAAKEKYAGRLNVIYGVELAQMMHKPDVTGKWLEKYRYEYVIGSTHTLRDRSLFSSPDFFDGKSDAQLKASWELYLSEVREMLTADGYDVLAHITYPTRYYYKHGKEYLIDLEHKGRDQFEDILKAVINKGIALEINTSGLRQPIGVTLPNRDLAAFYYELGGRELSFGSDAHYAADIGKGLREAYRMCFDIGFRYFVVIENGIKKHYALEKELEK